MEYLQRRIIVYSIMYYEQSESCIEDFEFDSLSKQLVEMMETCTKEECRSTRYWYVLYDFDGSTGFFIYGRLNKEDKDYLSNMAAYIHKMWKSGGYQNGKRN